MALQPAFESQISTVMSKISILLSSEVVTAVSLSTGCMMDELGWAGLILFLQCSTQLH